jgi:tRNA (cytidine32/uridine32-2'-O)-methyltransferase
MIDEIATSLTRIRIVLVETTHPGNIGAVARAMKTMGLARLELVAPKAALDAEMLARASGADDVLEHAGRHATLPEALVGCRLVIGASARLRTIDWPLLEPPDCAQQLFAEAAHGEVALVFGRESSGLSNVELARCQALVHIPTNPEFSSLNLAAAVQVLAYEIRRAARAAHGAQLIDPPRDLATADEMESFHGHLTHALGVIQFGDPAQSHKLMRRLRRLFHRANPDRTELNILRGILTAAERRHSPSASATAAEITEVP